MKKNFIVSVLSLSLLVATGSMQAMYCTTVSALRGSKGVFRNKEFGAKKAKQSGNKAYGRVVKGAQIVTGGYLIYAGLDMALQDNEKLVRPVEGEPMPELVEQWVRATIENVDKRIDAKALSLLVKEDAQVWSVCNDKAVVCTPEDAKKLELYIKGKYHCEKAYTISCNRHKKVLARKPYGYINQLNDIEKDINSMLEGRKFFDGELAKNSWIIKHELGHYSAQDSKRTMYSFVAIPAIVEAGFGLVRYSCKRLFTIGCPKSFATCLFRVLLSVGSLQLKDIIDGSALVFYDRFQETKADQFACEHVESRMELEQAYELWNERHKSLILSVIQERPYVLLLDEKDRDKELRSFFMERNKTHPYYLDRAAMVQEYLEKWDADHKEETF